ncbi:cellulose biosynthesis protein BcsN [Camelimonas sp. ID_303_24]
MTSTCRPAMAGAVMLVLAGASAGAMPASAALASLPPSAGRVMAVEENGAGSGVRQRIVLSGGHMGANTLEIALGQEAVAPSPALLESELASRFPGVAMTPLPGRMLKSRYGAMHVSIGAPAGGGRCLFAWQSIRDFPGETGILKAATPAVIRIRLCSARATLDQLAEMSEQIMLTPPVTPAPALVGDAAGLRLSPIEPEQALADETPRIQLAQASGRRRARGGPILDPARGNPGGLIGLLRGYSRTDPIGSTRRSGRVRSAPQQETRFGYRPLLGNDDLQPQSGLLGRWNGRSEPRRAQSPRARRYVEPSAPRQAAPRRVSRPAAAPPRRRAEPAPQRRQVEQATPAPNVRAPLQGYQTPGGARYLGPAPGAAPIQTGPSVAPLPGPGGGAPVPQVPRPAQGGAVSAPAAPLPRPAAHPGSQPGPMGGQPAARGLDPSLPGRAYRGPGG